MRLKQQAIQTVVDKVMPFGVFVKIGNGQRGYIRRREMSWEGDLDPRELVRPGQTLEALVLPAESSGETLVLSHRATLPDPWLAFSAEHKVGDSVSAQVKRLGVDTVWVEVRPGVQGSIALDELDALPADKPEEVVWPGDDIVAVITQLNLERRLLRLSMRRRLKQLAFVTSVMRNMTAPVPVPEAVSSPAKEAAPIGADALSLSTQEIVRIGNVLVVEDKDDLRESLIKWLTDRGLRVEGVATAETALEAVNRQAFGLYLIDIVLGSDDGLALVARLQAMGRAACTAVMSTPEYLDRRSSEIGKLGLSAALAKPLDLSELAGLLQILGQGECPQLASEVTSEAQHVPVFCQDAEESTEEATFQQRLQMTLENALQATQAEQVVLFVMELPGKSVNILGQAGPVRLNLDALYLLSHSPVEDVISELAPVVTDKVSAEPTRRFEKLQPLLPFESCMGYPVITGGEVRHALFFFHRKPKAFNSYRQRDAQAVVTLLAAHLERHAFDQQILLTGDILLSGRLASAFGHEVHNKMSTVELQAVNLRHDLEHLAAGDAAIASELGQVRMELDALLRSTMQLKETVRRFQDLMRAAEQWELDVNEVAAGASAHLRALLGDKQISFRPNLSAGLPPVPGNSQRLHYVVLNLMLNAIYHLEAKAPEERYLELRTSYEPERGARPVRMRLVDSGPGIHKQLWERVFQLGFSTRPEGTGLGLYIARSLVENMGGRISIERSVIGIGTTFLLAFPEARREEHHDDGAVEGTVG